MLRLRLRLSLSLRLRVLLRVSLRVRVTLGFGVRVRLRPEQGSRSRIARIAPKAANPGFQQYSNANPKPNPDRNPRYKGNEGHGMRLA